MYVFSYFQQLQPFFKFDPLLLRLYVKQSAVTDLKSLVGKVPADILIMRMAEDILIKLEVYNS